MNDYNDYKNLFLESEKILSELRDILEVEECASIIDRAKEVMDDYYKYQDLND